MNNNCLTNKIINWLLLPFILIWNIFVTVLIIGAFTAWWGFLFGSVIAIVLLLIFASDLFFLPAVIAVIYVPFFGYRKGCEENEKNLNQLKLTEKEEYNLFAEKMRRGELTEEDIDSLFVDNKVSKQEGNNNNHEELWDNLMKCVTSSKIEEIEKFNKDIELLTYDGQTLIIEEKGDYIWENWDTIETYIYKIFGEETQIKTTKLL